MFDSTAKRLSVVRARPLVICPYERVSAVMGREDEAFMSPDIQRKANLDIIARHPNAVLYPDALEHPDKYRDIDRSGLDFHRDGIQRLLDLKARGIIDGIATYNVSRVGRSTSETLAVIDQFRANDGIYMSYQERIDDSPFGEWMLTNIVAMGQLQVTNIALGWRAVIEARAEQGHHNGTPPVGYRRERQLDSMRTRIAIDPAVGPAVLDAFLRYANGEKATRIERSLQQAGVISPKTEGLLKQRTFANPFYMGQVRLWAYMGKPAARPARRMRIPNAAPFVAPGVHPPLLATEAGLPDLALWQAVQDRLAGDQRLAHRHRDPVHALGGLATCWAGCGRAATHQKGRPGVVPAAHFRCCNGRKHDGCPGFGTMHVDAVMAHVLREVMDRAQRFEIGDVDVAGEMARRTAAIADRDATAAKLVKVKEAIAEVDVKMLIDGWDKERADRAVALLQAQAKPLQAALDAMPALGDLPAPVTVVQAARKLADKLPTATPGEVNGYLRACGVVAVGLLPRDPSEPQRGPLPSRRVTVVFDR